MGRGVVFALSIGVGLPIAATDLGGLLDRRVAEAMVVLWCWGVFLHDHATSDRRRRIEMWTVIAFATPMELFFSEVWRIYEYQYGLMPLFVPPGHWFLFDLGRRLTTSIHSKAWRWSPLLLLPLVVWGVVSGTGTMEVLLLMALVAFVRWGPDPSLYATMTWIALLMELWGTWLGNWAWSPVVPLLGATAWNPPLLVGSFYALGDVLVGLSVRRTLGQD
jgi:hypothetical protein